MLYSIQSVLTIIYVSLLAFENDCMCISNKKNFPKEILKHVSDEPVHDINIQSYRSTRMKELAKIVETETLINDFIVPKSKKIRHQLFQKNQYDLGKQITKPKNIHKSVESSYENNKQGLLSKSFMIIPVKSLKKHKHQKVSFIVSSSTSNALIEETTVHCMFTYGPAKTKLKNVTLTPVDFLTRSGHRYSSDYVTLPTFKPSFTQITNYGTKSLNRNEISTSTTNYKILNNERIRNLTYSIKTDLNFKNNISHDLNTCISVKKVPCNEVKETAKVFPYSCNETLNKLANLTSSGNTLNFKNSINSSCDSLQKQQYNGTRLINNIKNNYTLNLFKINKNCTSNTYSTVLPSNYFTITADTSVSRGSFTINSNDLASTKIQLNHTTINSTLNKNINLKSFKTQKVNESNINLNESDSENWFSSFFMPIKNKLWFLLEPRPAGKIISINNTGYSLFTNETEDDKQAMFLKSLNSSNVTLLFTMDENRKKANSLFYAGNITSFANFTNSSLDPTIIIANNTVVSVIANGSQMHPEVLKENRTWLGRMRAKVVHWVGDVYDCLTNYIEPVSYKDVRFFLYTRNNSNEPEELFLRLQDITTTTEDNSDVPEMSLNETRMFLCNDLQSRNSQSSVAGTTPGKNDSVTATIKKKTTARTTVQGTNNSVTAAISTATNEYKTESIATTIYTTGMGCRKKSVRKKQKQTASKKDKFKNQHKCKKTSNRKLNKHHRKKYKRPVCSRLKSFIGLNTAKSLYSKYFNVLHPTKIIIHGYTQSYLEDSMVKIREAYLTKAPSNIIMVDWSSLSHSPCYPMVTKQSRNMGLIVSHLLEELAMGGVDMATVHMIGFSIGAQIAGYAGAALETQEVYRVTGLDPASPFYDTDPGSSLDATDATFVDVIHSSAGFLGKPDAIGHADFYPNGGSHQPGCDFTALACSHDRAARYFAESILSDIGFPAYQCASWQDFQNGRCNSTSTMVLMGDQCSPKARGTFYLMTGETEPFSDLRQHNNTKKSLFFDIFK